ncbi:VanW family protein [Virgibacillus ndiopensis]|uniref:VanW family protein n=1 Tax=Virgibacillus ndiopensis TaxID=2004408 RepID=UPI000C07D53E|nr:VanW family protein [Virgibacillus ndiopensis]
MTSLIFTLLFTILPPNTVPSDFTVMNEDKPMITVNREYYTLLLLNDPFIDEDKVEFLLDKLEQKIYRKPIDAKLDDMGEIVSEKPGMTLDRDKLNLQFRNYFYYGQPQKVKVPTRTIYPRVDSELLASIHVNEIGNYVTYFKQSNKERSHNIDLAAEAINNYVVFPGEIFSFNKIVGKRTKEKGYKRAPVIVKGELAEDIGGGICQVSSTLYNAVDLAGLEVVERYSHSRSVPYVPPGRDATVSWYGPDFSFKNKYNQPVLIRAQSSNGKMHVKIYSSEDISGG